MIDLLNDKCPFCDTSIVANSQKKMLVCNGNNCNYAFYKTDNHEGAQELYRELISFGEKKIIHLSNGEYYVAILDEIHSFSITRLTDIVDLFELQMLIEGLVKQIGLPASIVLIDIKEPDDQSKYEILYYTGDIDGYCEHFDKNGIQFKNHCFNSIFQNIKQIIDELNNGQTHENNHAFVKNCSDNNVQMFFPININQRIMGFIVICSLIIENDGIAEDKLHRGLKKEELSKVKLSGVEKTRIINRLIENIYLGKRRRNESYFFNSLNQLFLSERKKQKSELKGNIIDKIRFKEISQKALDSVNEFARIQYSFLLMNNEISKNIFKLICVSKNPYIPLQENYNIQSNDVLTDFLNNDVVHYYGRNNDDDIFKIFQGAFKDYKPHFAAFIPINIKGRNGILVLVNRSIIIGQTYKRVGSPAFRSFLVNVKREMEMDLGLLNYELKRGIYLSNISHEIINPLDKIVGRVEFILENKDLIHSEEYRNRFELSLRDMLLKAKEMELKTKSIITERNLLHTSGLKLQRKSLYDIIEPNVHMLVPKARIKKIFINYQMLSESWIPQFYINEENFTATIFNLLENAIKYSNENTTIDIEVRIDRTNNKYLLEISNYGIGVLENERVLIFELEERGSNVNDAGGLGRGLWIAQRSMQSHRIENQRMDLYVSSLTNPTIFQISIPSIFKVKE